jgi:c-di-GMP-related signal transduction protein
MDVFVARQPIFDRRGEVVAYELLYRSGLRNALPEGMDLDLASAKVICDALSVFGYDVLLDKRPGYVNASEKVLLEGWYRVLPPGNTVVEVLETVRPTQEIVASCHAAKMAGYRLALDDFEYRPELRPLLDLADIVKVDFLLTVGEPREVARSLIGHQRLALAEKVETVDEYRCALDLGYDLFQGYFFCRPEIVQRKDISPGKLAYVHLLRELNKEDLDFPAVETVIKRDPALALKLLRFLNSAAFGWRSRVESLKQALIFLGERPFRRWAALIAMAVLAADKPMPLLMSCMVRARFAESLVTCCGHKERALDAFFAGMVSSLDALIGRPMDELLEDLRVAPDLRAALLGTGTGPLSDAMGIVMAYEVGNWDSVAVRAHALGIQESVLATTYCGAVEWARECWPDGT